MTETCLECGGTFPSNEPTSFCCDECRDEYLSREAVDVANEPSAKQFIIELALLVAGFTALAAALWHFFHWVAHAFGRTI